MSTLTIVFMWSEMCSVRNLWKVDFFYHSGYIDANRLVEIIIFVCNWNIICSSSFPNRKVKIKYQVETEQNHHNPSRYFNIVVNGIYDIHVSQRLVLLAEVIMVTRENYWPAASRWQTISHKVAKQHSKDGNRTKKRSWGETTTADVDRKGNNIQPQIQIKNSHLCSRNSLTFRKTWFHPCVVVGFVLLKL